MSNEITHRTKARSTGSTAELAPRIVAVLREEGTATVLSRDIESFARTVEDVTGVAMGHQLLASEDNGVCCFRIWIAAEAMDKDDTILPIETA